jgi:hypothetical protein
MTQKERRFDAISTPPLWGFTGFSAQFRTLSYAVPQPF